jgi:hypothetical protein
VAGRPDVEVDRGVLAVGLLSPGRCARAARDRAVAELLRAAGGAEHGAAARGPLALDVQLRRARRRNRDAIQRRGRRRPAARRAGPEPALLGRRRRGRAHARAPSTTTEPSPAKSLRIALARSGDESRLQIYSARLSRRHERAAAVARDAPGAQVSGNHACSAAGSPRVQRRESSPRATADRCGRPDARRIAPPPAPHGPALAPSPVSSASGRPISQ